MFVNKFCTAMIISYMRAYTTYNGSKHWGARELIYFFYLSCLGVYRFQIFYKR